MKFQPSPLLNTFSNLKTTVKTIDLAGRSKVNDLGIPFELAEVLFLLNALPADQKKPSQIAKRLQITPSTLTNRLIRLEENQWAVREAGPDRRSVTYRLTKQGMQMANDASEAYDQGVNQAIAAEATQGPTKNPSFGLKGAGLIVVA